MKIDPELLELLACPACKHPVAPAQRGVEDFLVCTSPDCRLAYPIRQDIPIMLEGEAQPWRDEA